MEDEEAESTVTSPATGGEPVEVSSSSKLDQYPSRIYVTKHASESFRRNFNTVSPGQGGGERRSRPPRRVGPSRRVPLDHHH